jgi:beta-glucosidase
MAINQKLLMGLKDGVNEEKPFTGFLISDYDEVGKVSGQGWPTTDVRMGLEDAIVNIINAGMDMMMLAVIQGQVSIDFYQETVKWAVENGNIDPERIDNAVMRILGVKLSMGLIKLKGEIKEVEQTRTVKEMNIDAAVASLKSAEESLVLLKNKNNVLPLKSDIEYIVLIGERDIDTIQNGAPNKIEFYKDNNNIGAQNGGWSVRW